jgi:hypothetical protein
LHLPPSGPPGIVPRQAMAGNGTLPVTVGTCRARLRAVCAGGRMMQSRSNWKPPPNTEIVADDLAGWVRGTVASQQWAGLRRGRPTCADGARTGERWRWTRSAERQGRIGR